MTLSLDPQINPLLRLYELFSVPGITPIDSPSYLGIKAPLKWSGPGEAFRLFRFLSGLPSGMLQPLTLEFDQRQLADFAAESADNYFEWDTIDELVESAFCDVCAEVFLALKTRFAENEAGAPWPNRDEDSLSLLDDLESCPTCSPHFRVEAAIDKSAAVEEFLLSDLLPFQAAVSGLIWSSPDQMTAAFESFQEFLDFVRTRVDKPLVLFCHQPIEPYEGNYFKILSLNKAGVQAAELEAELTRQLAGYTTDVLASYKMLRTDHRDERRTALGDRFDITPALFLRQSGEAAAYPAHPVFQSGPVRSLLIYAMMAWLAVQTEQIDDGTVFTLSEDERSPLQVSLNFGLTDVTQNQKRIFSDDKWSEISGRLARDIEQSIGSEYFRDCWAQSMADFSAADFAADRFFATLEAVRQKSETKRWKPHQDILSLTPDLALFIYVDALNKKLVFQLGYLNPDLGLGFNRFDAIELNPSDHQELLQDLDVAAKRHMTSMLDDDPDDPKVKIPTMVRLETRGEVLWDDYIPIELKRAYIKLRNRDDLSLFIFSEDRSFPWELIKPRELAGSDLHAAGFSDDWWALRFGLARWAVGAPPPANEIPITRVCLAASSALSSAAKEIEYFRSLEQYGVLVDQPQTMNELLQFLGTNAYDVIHLACHGQFISSDPGESAIQLPDKTLLHPDDLRVGNILQQIKNNRPLVFLNCCHSGRTGSTLVGIAGWAKRLVDWECGAFIGCGWEVADPLAAEFAIKFYKNFRDKQKSLGQSVYQARRQIKQLSIDQGRPHNSTWLAYYLYGNPNCHYAPQRLSFVKN